MVARHNAIGDVGRIQQIHGGIGIGPLGCVVAIDDVSLMGNIDDIQCGLCCSQSTGFGL